MNFEDRLALVTRNSVEVVTDEEIAKLLQDKEHPAAYIGFEPSGLVHLGWVLVAQKIRDLTDAGFTVTIYWADWHAYINDKLGGDLDNIKACARYMEDCFVALGVPRDKVQFRYASEILSDMKYWEMAINVAKATSLSRVKRPRSMPRSSSTRSSRPRTSSTWMWTSHTRDSISAGPTCSPGTPPTSSDGTSPSLSTPLCSPV